MDRDKEQTCTKCYINSTDRRLCDGRYAIIDRHENNRAIRRNEVIHKSS